MTEWSPTRRQFLGVTGASGLASAPAALGNATFRNVTDAVPDHPFVPSADVHWSADFGDDSAYLVDRVADTFYVRVDRTIHAVSHDGTGQWTFEVENRYPDVRVGPESFYQLGNRTVYVGDDDRMYALNADDGSVRWRYDGDQRLSVESASSGLVVAFETTRFGQDDALVGLSAADGSERWRVPMESELWLRVQNDGETLYAGTNEGRFYAVDSADGSVRWRVELPELDAKYSTEYPHLLAVEPTDDRAFAWDSDRGTLYAFDASDGSERWRFESEADVGGLPGTIRDDTVYFYDDTSLYALSTADGSERWRTDLGVEQGALPKVVAETIYVGSEDGIHALSTETGRQRWQSGTGMTPVGVTGNTLVADGADSSVYALSTADGRVRWQYDAGEPLVWYPQIREGTVYLGTESGTVAAVSNPGDTPVADALRTVTSPASLAVGSLLGGALAVGAYHRTRTADATAPERTGFDDFELVEPLSATDDAEVHEARTPDGNPAVLTRLREDAIAPDAFADAVETWADLDHEGVLDVREWGTDPVPWVATERADATLADRADDLSVPELVRAVADVAETLHRAHREGVAHGRLTSETVLVCDDEVRVGDWRLAAELRDSPTGDAPPEDDPDPEVADTYRLAASADDLLADERTGDELENVLACALADDPDDRYDSALKFADELRWAARTE